VPFQLTPRNFDFLSSFLLSMSVSSQPFIPTDMYPHQTTFRFSFTTQKRPSPPPNFKQSISLINPHAFCPQTQVKIVDWSPHAFFTLPAFLGFANFFSVGLSFDTFSPHLVQTSPALIDAAASFHVCSTLTGQPHLCPSYPWWYCSKHLSPTYSVLSNPLDLHDYTLPSTNDPPNLP